MPERTIFSIAALAIFAVALAIGVWRQRRYDHFANQTGFEELPRLGFVWGYAHAYFCLILGTLFGLALLAAAVGDGLGSDGPLLLALSSCFFGVGYGLYIRNRWIWIVYTVLGTPGLGWIVNGIYLKNRWTEMKREASVSGSLKLWWFNLSTRTRALVAGTLFWCICVFVWKSSADDYISSSELARAMLIPPAITILGYILWQAVVKKPPAPAANDMDA